MAEGLRALGHEVEFLHLQQPLRFSDSALRQYWGDRLHVFRGLSPASCVGRGRRKLLRLTATAFHLNLPVDSYFDPAASRYLRELLGRHPADAVIVSYVFYSRLLESLPNRALKLIDTHDVFSDRYRLYREHGQPREFFSTRRQDEGKALDRADIALAIQESDARHFRSISRTPVSVVGHLAPLVESGTSAVGSVEPAMLFVGGSMGINVHGVAWFIRQVLPLVRRQVPQAELWLAGDIGRRFRTEAPGVRRLGFVDGLGDVYRRAAVVINPQQFGTGLSIKSVDALLHGRPLVASASGARGLEDGAGVAFLRADSAEQFAEDLIELLRDPARGAALAERAREFAREYHERNLRALATALEGQAGRREPGP